MEKTGIVYKATSPTGKVYIGQTIRSLNIRKGGKYNPYFQNAINKYKERMKWEIIGKYPIKQLDSMERYYIYYLDTIYPNGYNFESGGNKNKMVSEETKKKISEARKGRKHSKETKRKMSDAQIGHAFYGKRFASKETKRKMSDAQKGKIVSLKTKIKISTIRKGKKGEKHTKQTREKISKANIGEKNPMAKLSWKIVNKIRLKYKNNNYTQSQLSILFNVSKMTINKIVRNKTWKI